MDANRRRSGASGEQALGGQAGFALLLKFLAAHGRFPWSGRSIERHRAEIREALGFRECSMADADMLTDWLVTTRTQAERRANQVRADLLMQSAVWESQGGDGRKQFLELSTLPDVENVAPAPS